MILPSLISFLTRATIRELSDLDKFFSFRKLLIALTVYLSQRFLISAEPVSSIDP